MSEPKPMITITDAATGTDTVRLVVQGGETFEVKNKPEIVADKIREINDSH